MLQNKKKKRQLLSFLSGGIEIPNFLVQYEFNKENQTKKIDFINLKKFYDNPVPQKKFDDIYNKNKNLYTEIFKEFKYVELSPSNIIGENEYNENYFNKINEIENKTLDGIKIDQIAADYNLNTTKTGLINKKNNLKINKKLVESFFKIEKKNILEFINIDKKYYVVELTNISKKQKDKNNIEVKNSIKAQIIIEKKINENTKIAKEITNKKFTRAEMDVFAKNNGLEVQSTTLTSSKDNNTFSAGVIKRIFETDNKSINLITDNMLKDNFIIYVKDTKLPKIKEQNDDYESYKLKAKLRLANNIYNIYDLSLNKKYKVEINNKTLNRIKNSF